MLGQKEALKMILIAKIRRQIFNNDDYYLFDGWCGKKVVFEYVGDNPPKPLKTVEYQFNGKTEKRAKGNVFKIEKFKKVGKILIYKPERLPNL